MGWSDSLLFGDWNQEVFATAAIGDFSWFMTFGPSCKESQLQCAVFPSVLLAAALPSKLHVIQSQLF